MYREYTDSQAFANRSTLLTSIILLNKSVNQPAKFISSMKRRAADNQRQTTSSENEFHSSLWTFVELMIAYYHGLSAISGPIRVTFFRRIVVVVRSA
jgi:hypothetical protein